MKLMHSETLDRLLELVLYCGGRCAQHFQDSEHAHPSQVQLAEQHHGLRCVKALESRHLSTRLGVLIAVICFLAYAAMAQQVSCKVKKCCSVSIDFFELPLRRLLSAASASITRFSSISAAGIRSKN
jgi:hypothetical protein